MKKTHRIILNLLKKSVLGNDFAFTAETISEAEWEEMLKFAIEQGVAPVLMTEIEKLPKTILPHKNVLLKWFGYKMSWTVQYKRKFILSCDFANSLEQNGVKCLVLKGFTTASYYPIPETRVFGDLDCFLVSSNVDIEKPMFEIGNEVARKMGYIVEDAGYKHTHIHYKNLLIENHKYFTNFNETKQGVKIERLLRHLVLDGKSQRLGNTNLWKPSPEFNVIFLLKHSLGDFIANDMALKSLYDWAMFLKAEQKNIDWDRMFSLLKKCKLKHFFFLMTETCIAYLGLDFHVRGLSDIYQRAMVDDMINDVLHKPSVDSGHLNLWQKIPNILKRFKRQYKYRKIETENVFTLICNTITFSSFLHRKVTLD